jgi:hypothetical protein
MAHTEITPAEQADRLAIRELVDAYARCADTRASGRALASPRLACSSVPAASIEVCGDSLA